MKRTVRKKYFWMTELGYLIFSLAVWVNLIGISSAQAQQREQYQVDQS
jgi:hypothetical protein